MGQESGLGSPGPSLQGPHTRLQSRCWSGLWVHRGSSAEGHASGLRVVDPDGHGTIVAGPMSHPMPSHRGPLYPPAAFSLLLPSVSLASFRISHKWNPPLLTVRR